MPQLHAAGSWVNLMGLWFFLSVVVVGNVALKAYRLRLVSRNQTSADDRMAKMELELKTMREKIQHLEEAVFLGDFELKRQFSQLESEMVAKEKQAH